MKCICYSLQSEQQTVDSQRLDNFWCMEIVRLNRQDVRLTGAQLQVRCPLMTVVEGLDQHRPLTVEAARVQHHVYGTGGLVDAQKLGNRGWHWLRIICQWLNGANGIANEGVRGGLVVNVRCMNCAD